MKLFRKVFLLMVGFLAITYEEAVKEVEQQRKQFENKFM
jgi:hypothetical protein